MMPWGWMVLFAVGGSFSAFAQVELGQCDAAPAPNAEVLKAEQALDRADANMARVYLNAVQRKSPDQQIHFQYLSAELSLLSGRPESAASLFYQVYQICPDYHPDLRYKLGALWAGQGRQADAAALLEAYVESAPAGSPFLADARQQIKAWAVIDSLKQHPISFTPYRIRGLDAPADEFLGVLSPDERTWYFTRRQEVLDRKSGPAPIRRLKEEFCVGRQSEEGVVEIVPLSPPFNQGFNEGGPSLTADNRWMALTSCQVLGNGYRNCDIFLVQNTYDVWLDFKPLVHGQCPRFLGKSAHPVGEWGRFGFHVQPERRARRAGSVPGPSPPRWGYGRSLKIWARASIPPGMKNPPFCMRMATPSSFRRTAIRALGILMSL